ncbi:hypothetical protein U0070_009329, partial [Myodes glareolus]
IKTIPSNKTVYTPENVSTTQKHHKVIIKGPRRTLWRDCSHKNVELSLLRKKKKKLHVRNIVRDVIERFCYKMKHFYTQFPINTIFLSRMDLLLKSKISWVKNTSSGF